MVKGEGGEEGRRGVREGGLISLWQNLDHLTFFFTFFVFFCYLVKQGKKDE